MGNIFNKKSLEDDLITFKMTSRQMNRSSKKCEKNEKANIAKLKAAVQQGNVEGARIYGQNAIREKNQALTFLRLASRIDAVASRLETAVRMQQVSEAMGQTVNGMANVMASMDDKKISATMDKFEKLFEDMDVKSAYMEDTMDATTSMTTPPEQVDELIQKVADEHGLNLGGQLDKAGAVGTKIPGAMAAEEGETTGEDDLEARLAALRK